MVNKKITDLTDLPTPVAADVIAIVDDVGGAGVATKKATLSNALAAYDAQISTLENKTINTSNNTLTVAAADVSDFDTEVGNNSAVTANTAKTSNATHTGDVTGSTTLTIESNKITKSMIQTSAKTEALIIAVSDETTALAGTETAKFVLPYGFEITKVKGSLNVTGTANVVATVTRAGSALATVTISGTTADDSSPTNTTGSENDVISITTTSGTANATGLKIYLIGYQT
jgi:hypothetical protein